MMFEHLFQNDTLFLFVVIMFVIVLLYTCYKYYKWRQLVISTMEAIIKIPKKLEDIDNNIKELEKSIKIHHISAVDK